MEEKDLEAIAETQHEIWARWMKYLFSVCTDGGDGSAIIPADKVERWKRQIETPYGRLSEKEKESDRRQAQKVIDRLAVERNYRDFDREIGISD